MAGYNFTRDESALADWNDKDSSDIEMKTWDYDTNAYKSLGTASIHTVAKCITPKQFAYLFDSMQNGGQNSDWSGGFALGRRLATTHRTLQGLAIRFAFGLLAGISKACYGTDARNEAGITAAHHVTEMVDSGEITIGYLI